MDSITYVMCDNIGKPVRKKTLSIKYWYFDCIAFGWYCWDGKVKKKSFAQFPDKINKHALFIIALCCKSKAATYNW